MFQIKEKEKKEKIQRKKLARQERLHQKRLQSIQIPVYVTQIIVDLLSADCVIDNDNRQILSLASVCKRWFDRVKLALQAMPINSKRSFRMPVSITRYTYGEFYECYDYNEITQKRGAYALCQLERLDFRAATYGSLKRKEIELVESYTPKLRELHILNLDKYVEEDDEIADNLELLSLPMPELDSLCIKHTTDYDDVISAFPSDVDQCIKLFQQCQSIELVDISDSISPQHDGLDSVVSALSILPRLTTLKLSRFGTFAKSIPSTVTSIWIYSKRFYGGGDRWTPEFKEYVKEAKQLKSLKYLFLDREWLRVLAHTNLTQLYLVIPKTDTIDVGTPLVMPTLEFLELDMDDYFFGINKDSNHIPYLYGFGLDQLPCLRNLVLMLKQDSWDYVTDLISHSKSIKTISTRIVGCTQTKCNKLFDTIQQSHTFKRLHIRINPKDYECDNRLDHSEIEKRRKHITKSLNNLYSTLIKSFYQYQLDHPESHLIGLQLKDSFSITNTNNHY
ncbi:hypothetical protein DFA_11839 [Cavenderia fasciculata]|uniref:Uncharacterized protein n=1 Tax=Cavenderia fasciculata TaxID=261658 RepID=F4QEC9_CACFS|nr:uncharacterized protein DFA_11839 [Cavenderia fasciculata]EGG14076.1 hypothetical protein DFA_11839 [Cavenderia fasciculata]|eukprot:XP_004350784.1 hypothetical protein DFA_11839 [Cavenderia fasciculata]